MHTSRKEMHGDSTSTNSHVLLSNNFALKKKNRRRTSRPRSHSVCNKTDEEVGPAEMLSVTQTSCFGLLLFFLLIDRKIIISQCGMDEGKFQPMKYFSGFNHLCNKNHIH